MGLNPEFSIYKGKGFNASHLSQSLNFDFAIVEKYKNKWSHLKYLVIPIDYFSLYSTMETGIEKWRVKNYAIYYDINSLGLQKQFEVLNGNFRQNFNRLISYYFNSSSDISCNTLGWGNKYSSQNNKDLTKTGLVAAKRHTTKKKEDLFNDNVNIIHSFIQFAKENNTTIIFITHPVYKTYFDNLDKKQLNETISTIQTIALKTPNTYYSNFLEDKSFSAEDFYDANHLNEKGAKKLTYKIDSIMNRQ